MQIGGSLLTRHLHHRNSDTRKWSYPMSARYPNVIPLEFEMRFRTVELEEIRLMGKMLRTRQFIFQSIPYSFHAPDNFLDGNGAAVTWTKIPSFRIFPFAFEVSALQQIPAERFEHMLPRSRRMRATDAHFLVVCNRADDIRNKPVLAQSPPPITFLPGSLPAEYYGISHVPRY